MSRDLEVDGNFETFRSVWRPAIGWLYIVICLSDFMVFPILWSIAHIIYLGNVGEAWKPLTLDGAGLFHISMGGILGISAWSSGKEKMYATDCDCNKDINYFEELDRKRRDISGGSRYKKIPTEEDEIL